MASVTEAFNSIGRLKPTLALRDHNLGSENGVVVGKKLTELKVPQFIHGVSGALMPSRDL